MSIEETEIDEFSESEINLRDERVPNLGYALVCSLFAFLFSIGSCYFALFSISFNKGLSSIPEEYNIDPSICLPLLPSKYLLPHSILFPVTYKDANKSFKTTSLIYLFESEFRRKAIQRGLLSYENYLEFSTDNYLQSLKQMSEKELNIGDPQGNFCYIGEPNMIVANSSNFEASFLPNSFLSKGIDKSMFKFTITSSAIVRGIESIKRMLTSQAKPLVYSFRVPNRIIEANCIGNGNCTKCKDNEKCQEYIIYDENLNFGIGGKFSVGDPASMVIVGYNDNIPIETENGVTIGGLILRGRNPNIGHSYQYLTAQISAAQESTICHAPKIVKGDLKCLKSKKRAEECNATPLECIDDRFCDKSLNYSLSIDNQVVVVGGDVVDMSFIPLSLIQEVLAPKHMKTKLCGYFLLPYYVVEEMEKHSTAPFANDAMYMSISYNNIPDSDKTVSNSKLSFSNISSFLFNDISL
jgi:hypothetical protein